MHVLLLLLLSTAHAQELRVEPYLQLMTTTSVVVRWETEDGDESRVTWGTEAGQLGFETTGSWFDSNASTSLHEVAIEGLQPATRYWYAVHSGAQTSGPFDFVTPAEASAEADVRVVAMSDMQRDSGNPTVFQEIVEDGILPFVTQELGPDLAAELSFLAGVVALCLQGGAGLDGGLEEGAGFADGFEVAVQADGSGAVAVAEHPAVHLGAEFAHFGAFGVGGQCAWLVVEGFDLFADGEVFVGDGAIGDTGVNEGSSA